jgi:hypothetical protein
MAGSGVYQSQNMTVLAHLQEGKSITSWEAIERWRITRLARVIDDLEKQLGHDIPSKWEASNGKRYKRYWLEIPKGQLEMFKPRTESPWHASAP